MSETEKKRPVIKKTTAKAPVVKKETNKQMILGATGLEAKKKYELNRSQRAALKPKGASISSIGSILTGEEIEKLCPKGVSGASLGIK